MEIEKFMRKRFADSFDKEHNDGVQCISSQMFIDGSGLYGNNYRSTMGFHTIIGVHAEPMYFR
jgi:hypothetical protein